MKSEPVPETAYSLPQIMLYFLKLGVTGFGGPVALFVYMQRLAIAQLAPGPLAAQLAIYMRYLHYRIIGATLVGITFVLPSFLMVVGLGWLYIHFGGLAWMQAVYQSATKIYIAQ